MRDVFVFRIGQLGDTLAALPAIKRLWGYYQGDNLILITNKGKDGAVTAWDVLRYTGYFKEVVFYDTADIKSLLWLIHRFRDSKNEKTLYYLMPLSSLKRIVRDYLFFKALCGIDKVFGMRESIGKAVIKGKGGNLPVVDKESVRLLKLVLNGFRCDYNTEAPPLPPLLFPPREAYEKADNLLKTLPEDRILIAIGHGSRMPAKRWFIERYKALCHRLVGYNGRIHLVLLGDKDDLDGGEYLKNGLDEYMINLAGVTSIIESAAILSRCALYIGNDTGIMHLAASMGVPAIGIFTARENPGRWEPYGEDNVVLRKEVDCAGCFLEECVEEEMKCLDMISVDEVFEKVAAFFQRDKAMKFRVELPNS